MRRIPLCDIRLTDRFWSQWQRVLRDVTIEAEYPQLVETNWLRNLVNAARATGKGEEATAALCDQTRSQVDAGQGGFTGYYFNDSDVYKWCEAAAYAMAGADPQVANRIKDRIDEVVGLIEAAQEPGGYINSFFQIKHPDLKWRNLCSMHEMYCGGHLIEAGVAVFDASGDRRLLDAGIRFADHVMSIFGPGKRRGYCGHEEIELALLRLAAATGQAKYKDFARWMIEERGKRPSVFEPELEDAEAMALSPYAPRMMCREGDYSGEYAQDHAPIREHTEIVGHAVRAMYLYSAATELAHGDEGLQQALERIWHNLTGKRMYITGGIGPSASNEGFTSDYDLPNLTAYAETCASIGLVLWGQKLLELTGNSEYADVVERALYNGTVSGISLSGDRFFYTNPLESRGSHERVPWFDCACCPPNIARLIGSFGWYAVSVSDSNPPSIQHSNTPSFWIHIPAGFEVTTSLGGVRVEISCESDYPWSGKFKVRVDPARPVEFELRLRIPGWADDVDTDLPGLESPCDWEQGYAVFTKLWKAGDVLTVDLGMEPRWVECNPRVRDNLGRIGLTRGPLVYCAEDRDLGFAPQLLVADTEVPLLVRDEPKLLGGVTTIEVQGFRDSEDFVDDLYGSDGTSDSIEAKATFIPYFAWCNRGPGSMQVWTRRA